MACQLGGTPGYCRRRGCPDLPVADSGAPPAASGLMVVRLFPLVLLAAPQALQVAAPREGAPGAALAPPAHIMYWVDSIDQTISLLLWVISSQTIQSTSSGSSPPGLSGQLPLSLVHLPPPECESERLTSSECVTPSPFLMSHMPPGWCSS